MWALCNPPVTDLGHFLSCRHLVSLDLRAARGEAVPPVRNDALLKDLRARGLRHEEAYLERLRAEGLNIAGADEGEMGPESPHSAKSETPGVELGHSVAHRIEASVGGLAPSPPSRSSRQPVIW